MILNNINSLYSQAAPLEEPVKDGKIKKSKINLYFYLKEKMIFISDNKNNYNEIISWLLKNEIYTSIDFSVNKIYYFSLYLNDLFLIDFNQLNLLYNKGITEPINIAVNMYSNFFCTGFDHLIKLKNIIDIKWNTEFWFNLPFNQPPYLTVKPVVNLSGNYYYGNYWENEIFGAADVIPGSTAADFILSYYTKIGYEFFRFYGPKNLLWNIMIDHYAEFYFQTENSNPVYANKFRFGSNLKYYNFTFPSIYFIQDSFYDIPTAKWYSASIGIQAGFYYAMNYLSFSIEYKGSYDFLSDMKAWESKLDTYIQFSLYD